MVGPVVKIDPASLPRRPNVHYFGQRGLPRACPSFVKGWDVCLLPFARNRRHPLHQPHQNARIHGGGAR